MITLFFPSNYIKFSPEFFVYISIDCKKNHLSIIDRRKMFNFKLNDSMVIEKNPASLLVINDDWA